MTGSGTLMGFRVAISTYRWFMSMIGRYYLKRMLHKGLPKHFGAPLLFLLTKRLRQEDQSVLNRIEAIRSRMANRDDVYVDIFSSPEPSSSEKVNSQGARPTPGKVKSVSLNWLANTSSVLPYWGAFLYLCVKASRAKTILELGGCAGISGCYMASAKDCNRFISIEGSPALASLAKSNLAEVADNFDVVNALFDSGLDEILPTLEGGLDMVYLDGQHEKTATFHYLERLTPHLNAECILVFDDIRWTPDMWEAWQTLCQCKGMAWTIDLGRFGVCVWDGMAIEPKNYNISRFTDLWSQGKPGEHEV